MRVDLFVAAAASCLLGCDSEGLTAPPVAPLEAPTAALALVKPPSSAIIACGGGTLVAEPLVVVDGVILRSADVATLDPESIASVEVVKSTAATSLYGSRASAGVVLVTTRRKHLAAAR